MVITRQIRANPWSTQKGKVSAFSAVNSLYLFFLLTLLLNYVKMLGCLPEGKQDPPVGTGYSGEALIFVPH